MNILSWKVLLFLKKEAVGGVGYTRASVADSMEISRVGLLRILRELVRKDRIRCVRGRNRPTLYMALEKT